MSGKYLLIHENGSLETSDEINAIIKESFEAGIMEIVSLSHDGRYLQVSTFLDNGLPSFSYVAPSEWRTCDE